MQRKEFWNELVQRQLAPLSHAVEAVQRTWRSVSQCDALVECVRRDEVFKWHVKKLISAAELNRTSIV